MVTLNLMMTLDCSIQSFGQNVVCLIWSISGQEEIQYYMSDECYNKGHFEK